MPSFQIPSLKRYLIWLLTLLEQIKSEQVWSFDDRLSDLEIMTILLEDRRFFWHFGIDPKSVVRAVVGVLIGNPRGGGSTIEMQLVRTVTNYRSRTFRRKLNEAILAILLGFHFSKGSILRTYMQIAYYGTGLRGVAQASAKAYGKYPEDLSFDESAVIAAMLVYPMPRTPSDKWLEKINRRASYGKLLYARHKQRLQNLSVSD